MTTEGNTFDEHIKRTNERIAKASPDLWNALLPHLLELNDEDFNVEQGAAMVTGVCANIFAQHNALLVADKRITKDKALELLPETFQELYKHSFEHMLKQFEGSKNA